MMKKEQRLVKEQSQEWLMYRKNSVTKSSFSTYQNVIYKHIIPILGECNIDDVEKNRKILLESLKGYSDTTKSGVITIFNSITKFNPLKLPDNQKMEVKDSEKIEIIPKDQIALFMDEVTTDIDSTKLGILCVIYAGLRIGELCSLQWKDIDLINNVIRVNKSIQRIVLHNEEEKTILDKKEIPVRYVPIPTKLLRVLLSRKRRLNDYVITGNQKQIEPRTAQYRLSSVCKKIGLCTQITYKKLRDYFAVNALANNVNAIVVADILGVEYDMMQKYMMVAKNLIDMEYEIEKLNHI